MNLSAQQIIDVMSVKGYKVFESDNKNFNINLIGIRTNQNRPNEFDDWMTVMWNYNMRWNLLIFKITTDPGLYFLENVMGNALGTAIMKEGRYSGLWQIGTHKGYKALSQKANVTVIRDFDRDGNLDFTSGREETGMFGINCHRANPSRQSIKVDNWSAGCQVFADPNDFNIFLSICEHAAKLWGNSFTYTLLHERDF